MMHTIIIRLNTFAVINVTPVNIQFYTKLEIMCSIMYPDLYLVYYGNNLAGDSIPLKLCMVIFNFISYQQWYYTLPFYSYLDLNIAYK